MKFTKILTTFLGALLAFSLSGCMSASTSAGAVGVDRKQMFLVSEKQMDESSAQYYSQVISKARQDGTLNSNSKQTKRVRNITSRLISNVGVFRQDALKWNWQVNVINEPTTNAWCMPGGRMVIYSGIIEKLNLNDAQIAAIMGHEMAHALREHSREQASTEQMKQIGLFTISAVTGSDLATNVANIAAQYTITLPYSRSHESEADTIGAELMARAGYDPREAVKLWQKMSANGGGSVAEFMSTHPSANTRIENLKVISNKLMPVYEEAIRK